VLKLIIIVVADVSYDGTKELGFQESHIINQVCKRYQCLRSLRLLK